MLIVEEAIIEADDSEYKKKTEWKKPGWTIGRGGRWTTGRGGNKKNQDDENTGNKAAPTTGTDSATPPVSPTPSSPQPTQMECVSPYRDNKSTWEKPGWAHAPPLEDDNHVAVDNSPPPVSPTPSSPHPTQMECVSPYRNNKSTWEKPAWAHAAPLEDDNHVAVDDSPIMNPLLRKQQDSYRRRVFAKDLVGQQGGKFVKAQEKQPDPRLTWIVVRINDDAVPGKIVMHLHGKDVSRLVDKFANLQGQEIERTGEQQLRVQGEPTFFITTATAKGLDSKQEVYGVVQEGQEIVAKLLAAGPEAKLSIKQAHIFPIKKSKKVV